MGEYGARRTVHFGSGVAQFNMKEGHVGIMLDATTAFLTPGQAVRLLVRFR